MGDDWFEPVADDGFVSERLFRHSSEASDDQLLLSRNRRDANQGFREGKLTLFDMGYPFTVVVDGEPVPARISIAALREHFGAGASHDSQFHAYKRNRAAIDAKAIEVRRRDPEWEPLLVPGDFYGPSPS